MRGILPSFLPIATLMVACGGDTTTTSADSGVEDCLDPVTWYADADADGYGVDAVTQEGCEQPAGFVGTGGDCDDTDDGIHPGVEEICDGADQDCNGAIDEGTAAPVPYFLDSDIDGYGDPATEVVRCERPDAHVRNGRDCDDDAPSVFPGATEVCDGIDQDCTGVADDGAVDGQTYYRDQDQDGVGVLSETLEACDQPSGYATISGDCDDDAPETYTGADEVCGGDDEDCDGTVDERDAVDAPTWYWDGDLDGYGDPFLTATSCSQPPGYVDNADDCDDTDAAFSPDAVEVCNGRDDNCDGATDGADSADASTWYLDSDGDGYGLATSTTLACDEPSLHASVADDCDDGDSTVNPGATEICGDGLDNDCSGEAAGCVRSGVHDVGDGSVKLLGESASDYSGAVIDAAGDLDGDGSQDMVVGSWYLSGTAGAYGGAHVVHGPVASGDLATAGVAWTGASASDYQGRAVAGAGDVDGDGLDDVLIASSSSSLNGNSSGTAYLITGPATAGGSLSGADATLYGWASGDALGQGVDGAGDLDGDGYGDLVLGAPYESSGASYGGAAYVVSGPVTGATAAVYAASGLIYGTSSAYLGYQVAGAGDLNGDGLDDLAIGAPIAPDSAGLSAGAVYVFYGPIVGSTTDTRADAVRTGVDSGGYAGHGVAGVGDTDGDGYADLAVGAPYNDTAASNAGAVYLVLGPVSGTGDLAAADAIVLGQDSSDWFGFHVAGGDLDGDGLADLVASAPYDGTDEGAVGVLLGPLSGSLDVGDTDLWVTGEDTYDYLGYGLGRLADIDGDGVDDLIVGALGDATNGSYAGAAYALSWFDP